MTSPSHHDPGQIKAEDAADRAAAQARAFRLIREVQGGFELSTDEIDRFIEEAESRGWPEVVCANLLLEVVRAEPRGWQHSLAQIPRLLARAEAEGDPVWTAIALGSRSRLLLSSGESSAAVGSDHDLARATVLLEGLTGRPLERASAHIECAISFAWRGLRELELEHYDAAEALARQAPDAAILLPALLYNRAEAHLNSVASLRELGDPGPMLEQARRAAAALAAAAEVPEMPDAWLNELQVFVALLAAIAPDAEVETPAVREPVPPPLTGHFRLARAMRMEDRRAALDEARAAVGSIDRLASPEAHDLARCMAAEFEAELIGHETEGLGYARHLARLRWETRLSKLTAMQSLLQAERLRSEHAILSQHAYLDELTGLGNRRSLARYLEAIAAEGVTMIATVLVDIDHFKSVNDGFGHTIGDKVLIRIAALLHASVRPGDLAVRLGGDEFLLVLAGVPPRAARGRAQTIHTSIDEEPWDELAEGLEVKASLGFACGSPDQHSAALAAADAALYRSKAAGGDCVSGG